MSNQKISELPPTGELAGYELMNVNGVSRYFSFFDIQKKGTSMKARNLTATENEKQRLTP